MNVSEHSTLISFSDYHEGAAPALIVNHTSWDSLRYKQRYVKEKICRWLFTQGVSFVKKEVLLCHSSTLKNKKKPFSLSCSFKEVFYVSFKQSS